MTPRSGMPTTIHARRSLRRVVTSSPAAIFFEQKVGLDTSWSHVGEYRATVILPAEGQAPPDAPVRVWRSLEIWNNSRAISGGLPKWA
jgi:hypothetical protein